MLPNTREALGVTPAPGKVGEEREGKGEKGEGKGRNETVTAEEEETGEWWKDKRK